MGWRMLRVMGCLCGGPHSSCSETARGFQNRPKASFSPSHMNAASTWQKATALVPAPQLILASREERREREAVMELSYYRWKSFSEDEDRPEKPRQFGVTEIRGPDHCLVGRQAFEEILESMGEFVDGLKFSGGSHSLMPNDFIKEITDLAHKHNIYVSTGDWAEHLLRKGSSSFKHYVEECKRLGFDTIELNAGSLKLPEDVLLRFIRLIKSNGLKAKPQFSINFEKSDIPVPGHRAFGAYISPVPESSELVEDVDLLIRRAERCLEAGADMIMIDADDVCKHAESLRSDIVAKIIGRLGLQKTMFEASNDKTSEWFVKRYGPRVNLFVDHSEVMNLECLRGRNLGRNHSSVLRPSFFLV
ncbi:protein HEAT-STRESS-ASSOCIATED 32 [Zingiber officinale]|uniref:protein HEAT-STRESS-ASSOCIATED 32 n=1 Tax=Zingiber officinale TaxID=94328 RepID=UPI001C4B49E1|nr:protein HEAT-STRESS-ASSOCIATED 32-like isoform X2 [Zingiber officinale]XP_042381708.1 protein HEAT-STRESS-ASSOCIATED 32 [Zingiber officinale]